MKQPVIPDKTYYKIGEVAHLLDIKPSVIRYWETEFKFLAPEKSSKGQRLYSRQDIKMIQQIKSLLYEEKYTIQGVRNKFKQLKLAKASSQATDCSDNMQQLLRHVRQELLIIRSMLS